MLITAKILLHFLFFIGNFTVFCNQSFPFYLYQIFALFPILTRIDFDLLLILQQCRRNEISIGGAAHCIPSHSVHCYKGMYNSFTIMPPQSPRFRRACQMVFQNSERLSIARPLLLLKPSLFVTLLIISCPTGSQRKMTISRRKKHFQSIILMTIYLEQLFIGLIGSCCLQMLLQTVSQQAFFLCMLTLILMF